MSSRSSRQDVSPAPARTLLRLSKGIGRDAARSRQDGLWQRTERAASRGTGRAGHRLDRRNPNRIRVRTGVGVAVALGFVGAAVAVAAVRRGRHAAR
jgi:hypothetical protein